MNLYLKILSKLAEKQADFTKNDVDDKICDIMFKQNVLVRVRKNEPIIIAVRMVASMAGRRRRVLLLYISWSNQLGYLGYGGYRGETHSTRPMTCRNPPNFELYKNFIGD